MIWKISLLPLALLMAFGFARSDETGISTLRRRDRDATPLISRDLNPSCDKGKKFVCHYDRELNSFRTICVAKRAKYLKSNPSDFAGRCEKNARIWETAMMVTCAQLMSPPVMLRQTF
jgi:hypothetical protein